MVSLQCPTYSSSDLKTDKFDTIRKNAQKDFSTRIGDAKIHALSALLMFDIRNLPAIHPLACALSDEDAYEAMDCEIMKLVRCDGKDVEITKVFLKTMDGHLYIIDLEINTYDGRIREELILQHYDMKNPTGTSVWKETLLNKASQKNDHFLINHSPTLKRAEINQALSGRSPQLLFPPLVAIVIDYVGYPAEIVTEDFESVSRIKDLVGTTLANITTARITIGEYESRLTWYREVRSHIETSPQDDGKYSADERQLIIDTVQKGDFALNVLERFASSGDALAFPDISFIPRELSQFTFPKLTPDLTAPTLSRASLRNPGARSSRMHPKEKMLKNINAINEKGAILANKLILEYLSSI